MSLQLMYIGGGGGGGGHNCEQRPLSMCKTAYLMGMLMEMVSHWPFVNSNRVYCTNGLP
jgi:hypothetical protein